MEQNTFHVVADVAEKTTVVGVGSWLAGSWLGSFIMIYGGFIVGILGVIVVVIFKTLESKEQKRHNKVLEAKRWEDGTKS